MPRYINSAADAVKEDRNVTVGLWCCGLISSQADPGGDVNKTVPSNNVVVVVNAELDRNRLWEF